MEEPIKDNRTMSKISHKSITTQEIQTLLIEGAKYSANDDPEKAAKCYAHILDLESQDAEIYLLFARCLYGIALKRNGILASDSNVEQEDNDSGAEEGDTGDDLEKKQILNSRLYQFDQAEEDATNVSTYVDARGESILQSGALLHTDENEEEDGKNETNMSIGETFEDFLQGNLLENALELLYRARIMYMEPQNENKQESQQLSKDTQLKLGQLYALLGDIDQELEDFTQAVRDYEESLKFYNNSLAPEESDILVNVHLKLADAMRWSDFEDEDSLNKEQRLTHLLDLEKLLLLRIDKGISKDIEADKSHLERLKEDKESLEANEPVSSGPVGPDVMAQAILRRALGGPASKMNDLSKMIKKKKTKSKSKMANKNFR